MPAEKDSVELIAESAGLNQFDDVRMSHGISLLQLPRRYAAFLIYTVTNFRP